MKKTIQILGTLLMITLHGFSQNDSLSVISFDSYLQLVKTHHPVALQAQLQLEKGNAKLLGARGEFDPKVVTDISQKYLEGDQYFSLINSGLKVPTWYGVELKGGYEQSGGVYLNPENKTPNSGLLYAGISVSLGKGLFIDKRRAALKKAKIFLKISKTDQQLMLNDLLYEAGKSYWNWFKDYHLMKVCENAQLVAMQRFVGVKESALIGERATIDTLEAGIQVQNRTLLLQQSQLNYANSTAALGTFLWAKGTIPLEIATGTTPAHLDGVQTLPLDNSYLKMLDSLSQTHPSLQRNKLKISQLEVDKRLKKEQLKPNLNLDYNPITQPINGNLFSNYSINNYKWGVALSMPIFLRKERGAVKVAELKIQEKQLDLNVKQANILYKAKTALNKWNTSIDQVELFSQIVLDYNNLLKGEMQKFNTGESSLFMINSREKGYVDAQKKQIELITNNRTASLETGYIFGVLSE